MGLSSYSEQELFYLIHQDNEQAFTELMDRYWNRIYSQAIVYLKEAHKAQDLVQEVFLTLWKDRKKLITVESPADYLYIIARNKIFNEARRRIMLPLADDVAQFYREKQQLPDLQTEAKETQQLLQQAIHLLPPQRKKVFELSRQQGYTYDEIATELGISRETVKVHMVKALAYLRRYMGYHLTFLILFKFFF